MIVNIVHSISRHSAKQSEGSDTLTLGTIGSRSFLSLNETIVNVGQTVNINNNIYTIHMVGCKGIG